MSCLILPFYEFLEFLKFLSINDSFITSDGSVLHKSKTLMVMRFRFWIYSHHDAPESLVSRNLYDLQQFLRTYSLRSVAG